jgi:hypothetical protein
MKVAPVAAPAPVVNVIRSAVLSGDDVLDMKHGRHRRMVREVTVLTPLTGPLANEWSERASHQADRLSKAQAFA